VIDRLLGPLKYRVTWSESRNPSKISKAVLETPSFGVWFALMAGENTSASEGGQDLLYPCLHTTNLHGSTCVYMEQRHFL
jgi:hypothetical protein